MEEAPAAPAVRVSVDILELVKALQAQNGLRHNDYQRYHAYLTRRLHTLRKATGLTQGTSKRFVKKDVTAAAASTPAHLHIPLLLAERAWAESMALQQAVDASDGATSNQRVHRLHRLKKAVAHATALYELASVVGEPRTVLEAEAYALAMRASYALEKQDWATAADAFGKARAVYESLGSSAPARRHKELFAARASELAPSEKFARYNLGRAQGKSAAAAATSAASAAAASASAAAAATAAAAAAASSSPSSSGTAVFWRSTLLPLRNDKLARAVAAAGAKGAQLAATLEGAASGAGAAAAAAEAASGTTTSSGSAEALYLDTLSRLDEAGRLAEAEAARAAKDGREGAATDARGVGEYCRYMRLRHVLGHNDVLASAAAARAAAAEHGAPAEAATATAAGAATDLTGASAWHTALHRGTAAAASTPAAGGRGGGAASSSTSSSAASPAASNPGALAAANAVVSLYSRSLAALDEMLALAGGAAPTPDAAAAVGSGSGLPVDAPLVACLSARRAYYAALRARAAAAAHLTARRYADATLLLSRAAERAGEALAAYAALPAALGVEGAASVLPASPVAPGGEDAAPAGVPSAVVLSGVSEADAAALEALQADVQARQVTLQATALLDSCAARVRGDAGLAEAFAAAFGSGDSASSNKLARSASRPAYLVDRLAATSGLEPTADARAVAPWPPRPAAVPFKPFLFDLAFSHITYPALGGKANTTPAPAPAAAAGTPAGKGAGGGGAGGGEGTPSTAAAAAPASPGSGGGLLSWLTGR